MRENNIRMKNKAIIITILILLAGLAWYVVNNHKKPTETITTDLSKIKIIPPEQQAALAHIADLKCPEAYKTQGEKINSFTSFLNNYVDAFPETKGNTIVILTGRIDFLIGHQCYSTLKNFGYDGHSRIDDKVRQQIIATMIKIDIGSSTQDSQ